MKKEILSVIRGKKIQILEFSLFRINDQLELILKIDFNNAILIIRFYNVSDVSIQKLSMPMEIHGFDIIDNKQRGWEKDSRYEIRDFEDASIHFFCENIEII